MSVGDKHPSIYHQLSDHPSQNRRPIALSTMPLTHHPKLHPCSPHQPKTLSPTIQAPYYPPGPRCSQPAAPCPPRVAGHYLRLLRLAALIRPPHLHNAWQVSPMQLRCADLLRPAHGDKWFMRAVRRSRPRTPCPCQYRTSHLPKAHTYHPVPSLSLARPLSASETQRAKPGRLVLVILAPLTLQRPQA